MTEEQLYIVEQVLTIFFPSRFIFDLDENEKIVFGINASDLFYWNSSDFVPVLTNEDVKLLVKCRKETKKYWAELYCCRKRKQKPYNSWFAFFSEKERELFNECK